MRVRLLPPKRLHLKQPKPGIPGLKPGPERSVEHAGSGLKHEVCSGFGPSHLLLLREALSYDCVDRGFDECG